jgi:hypothetical protein
MRGGLYVEMASFFVSRTVARTQRGDTLNSFPFAFLLFIVIKRVFK